MKEKLNAIFYFIFSYKGVVCLNLLFFAMFMIVAVCRMSSTTVAAGVPFLLYAIYSYLLHLERKRFLEVCNLKDLIRAIAGDFAEELRQYKKLYGELPPEETSEDKVKSEKQNSESCEKQV